MMRENNSQGEKSSFRVKTHWLLKIVGWVGFCGFAFFALLAWHAEQPLPSLCFFGMSMCSGLMLLFAGSVKMDIAGVSTTVGTIHNKIKWDEVSLVEFDTSFFTVILNGKDKRLSIPGPLIWSGNDWSLMYGLLRTQIRQKQIEVKISPWASFKLWSKNTRVPVDQQLDNSFSSNGLTAAFVEGAFIPESKLQMHRDLLREHGDAALVQEKDVRSIRIAFVRLGAVCFVLFIGMILFRFYEQKTLSLVVFSSEDFRNIMILGSISILGFGIWGVTTIFDTGLTQSEKRSELRKAIIVLIGTIITVGGYLGVELFLGNQ